MRETVNGSAKFAMVIGTDKANVRGDVNPLSAVTLSLFFADGHRS